MPQQPPSVNGVMGLTDVQRNSIKTKLQMIQNSFEPTDDEPSLSTHGLVSRYNRENVGNEINGDTAEFVLKAGG